MTVTAHQYQLFPALSGHDMTELEESIKERGILVPVIYDIETNEIVDGHHRHEIAQRLGIDEPFENVRFKNKDDRINFILDINILRRHLTPEQRAEVALTLRGLGWSQRRIAQKLGVTDTTVSRDLSTATNVEVDRVVGLDGKSRPAKRRASAPRPPTTPAVRLLAAASREMKKGLAREELIAILLTMLEQLRNGEQS